MAIRYASIFATKYGTPFFGMVRIRCVGTLFQFAHKTFYVRHAAVSKDSSDHARRALDLGYSQVIFTASYFVVTFVL